MQIVCMPNNRSAIGNDSFLFGAVCKLRLVSYGLETVSSMQHCLIRAILWLVVQLRKKFLKNFISSRDGPERGAETRQRWKNARLPYICTKIHSRCRLVFLHWLYSATHTCTCICSAYPLSEQIIYSSPYIYSLDITVNSAKMTNC